MGRLSRDACGGVRSVVHQWVFCQPGDTLADPLRHRLPGAQPMHHLLVGNARASPLRWHIGYRAPRSDRRSPLGPRCRVSPVRRPTGARSCRAPDVPRAKHMCSVLVDIEAHVAGRGVGSTHEGRGPDRAALVRAGPRRGRRRTECQHGAPRARDGRRRGARGAGDSAELIHARLVSSSSSHEAPPPRGDEGSHVPCHCRGWSAAC